MRWFFRYIRNIWNIRNIPCFKFRESTKAGIFCLWQVPRTTLASKHMFLTWQLTFLASKQTFLVSKCCLNFKINFVIFCEYFTKIKIWFWHKIFDIYGIFLVSNFAKMQKSEYSAFCRALLLKQVSFLGSLNSIKNWLKP